MTKRERRTRFSSDGLPTDHREWDVEMFAILWRNQEAAIREIREHYERREKVKQLEESNERSE